MRLSTQVASRYTAVAGDITAPGFTFSYTKPSSNSPERLKGPTMRVAFHFDEDTAFRADLFGPKLALFRAINNGVPTYKRHVYIASGTVLSSTLPRKPDNIFRVAESLLGIEIAAWSTLGVDEIATLLSSKSMTAYVVDGLIAVEARNIHRSLKEETGYLGALEVTTNNPLSWVLYVHNMIAGYRIVRDELRVFYRDYELQVEDNRDHVEFDEFEESGLFSSVSWEDIGARDTVFDPYNVWDHAKIVGEAVELTTAKLSDVINEVFLRIAHVDPRLVNPLHGALKAFDQLSTAESLAHVSLSCRRLMETLANALHPAGNTKSNDGRALGKAQYRNRLWAYVEENLKSQTQQKIVLANLADVGARIDNLDKATNKGLHDQVEFVEVQRLLVALIALLYDLLTLTAPPLQTPVAPYSEKIMTTMAKILKHTSRPSTEEPEG
jgi:hypothetical protein